MKDQLTFTILGCGSSGGVPRLGGHWGACDPTDPKNRRQRCSILVTRTNANGVTRVLIDTSPDMRNQLLAADVGQLNAVVYTHAHADHVHGVDDLRMIVFNTKGRLQVWADTDTCDDLRHRFSYVFLQADGSNYPPICDLNTITGDIHVDGPGGPITLTPFEVVHGTINALGFRINDVAYLPDVSDIPPTAWDKLENLDCWIVDALRRAPHPTHSHLENTLNWIAKARPKMGVLTNMHNDLDYQTVNHETPDHIHPAYDGMTLTFAATKSEM